MKVVEIKGEGKGGAAKPAEERNGVWRQAVGRGGWRQHLFSKKEIFLQRLAARTEVLQNKVV